MFPTQNHILTALLAASLICAPQAWAQENADQPAVAPVFSGSVSEEGEGFTDDIDKAEAALKANPGDPEAHFLLAVAYSRTPYLERAIEELQRSRRLAAKTPEGLKLFDRKISEYEKMLAADPDNPQLLYRMGFGYYFRALGMEWGYIKDQSVPEGVWYRKAEKTFRHLLEVTPEDTAARNYLGYFLVEQDKKNAPEAIALWESVLKLQPEDPGAHMLLGQAYLNSGNLRKSVEYSARGLKYRNEWLAEHHVDPSKLFGRY